MISIIICSRKPDIPKSLKDNISETIGLGYELVVIDNSQNKYSIFQAYNEGVHRAKYPLLCFFHEDIMFHTKGWGKNVKKHFDEDQIGLIGIAGAHFVPKAPFSWNTYRISTSVNIIQRISQKNGFNTEHWEKLNYMTNSKSVEAVVIDGVWFCVRKSLFNSIKFDEVTFTSFHCYDIDICLQVRKLGFQVRVISDVLLEHFSQGRFDGKWILETEKLFEKWKSQLPQFAGIEITTDEILERNEMADLIFSLKKEILRIQNTMSFRIGKRIVKIYNLFRF